MEYAPVKTYLKDLEITGRRFDTNHIDDVVSTLASEYNIVPYRIKGKFFYDESQTEGIYKILEMRLTPEKYKKSFRTVRQKPRSIGRVEWGRKTHSESTGIFGLKPKQVKANKRLGGITTHLQKKGIHSLSSRKLCENGKKGGNKSYEMSKGIFALSGNELDKARKTAIYERGQTPWYEKVDYNGTTYTEIGLAYELSLSDEYKIRYRSGKEMVKLETLTVKLNSICHECKPVRTKVAIRMALVRYKIELRNRTKSLPV